MESSGKTKVPLRIFQPGDVAEELRALREELEDEVTGEVRFDDGSRAIYAADASNYRQVPIGVVLPRSAADVVATVAACRRHDVPVLSRGAGTSLAGQCCNVAVVIDTTKYLNHIRTIDPTHRLITADPGCLLDQVRHDAQQQANLTFGPDPSTHRYCSIGGMIGNDACGVHAQLAGRTSANVDSLEVLTYGGLQMRAGRMSEAELRSASERGGDEGELFRKLIAFRERYAGAIRKGFPNLLRRVSGFNNLDQLLPENGFHLGRALCGTEGTCVTVLEATLNGIHFCRYSCLVIMGFDDVYAASEDVTLVSSFQPVGLEGFDQDLVNDIRQTHLHQRHLKLLPQGGGWLMAQFWGDSPDEAAGPAQRLMETLRARRRPPALRLLDDPEQMDHLWKLRESGLGATARVPGQRDAWPGWEDSAVPPKHLGPYLRDLRALMNRYRYHAALYGHFGQGCVHCRITFDIRTARGIAHWKAFLSDAAELVVRYGGSLSGEHGDGQQRAWLLEKMYGPELVEAFREFKHIWDPRNRMNPGKVVDPYPVDANLRLGPDAPTPKVRTHFQFPEDNGQFQRAAERCVGVGKCRESSGTMCPSYMVTRAEEHATRGRAHALFEMLRGQVLKDGWRDEHVHDALGLCLSCKGCKSDCPMKVDMATYKAEFLSHYYQGRLRPRSAYAFGLIHWWAGLAGRMPNVVNALLSVPALKRLAKRAAGMAPQREIPAFAPETFRHWFEHRPRPAKRGERVVLWADTFNNHFHPEVAQAAVEVLENIGYHVTLQQSGLCCGRPLYDYGMLRQAKRQLRAIMRSLSRTVRQGIPIIGLEPSCVTVLRDELLNLFPKNRAARRLSEQTFLLSEFLQKQAKENGWEPPKLSRSAIVHGHCHHKSVLRFDDEKALLDEMGISANVLDSGCCGMAGSFGFEAQHYDISIKAGERVLLPAVRAATEEDLVLTDGFSCREQIEQQTDRRPLHIAQVLQMAYREGTRGSGVMPVEDNYAPARARRLRASRQHLVAAAAVVVGIAGVRAVMRG